MPYSIADLKIAAEQSAAKYGVDPDMFKALIGSESSWKVDTRNPYPVNGEYATGIAQFLPSTAKRYGVDVNDPISSLDGAAHYISDLQKQYLNPNAAIMAYKGFNVNSVNAVESGKNGAPSTITALSGVVDAVKNANEELAKEQIKNNESDKAFWEWTFTDIKNAVKMSALALVVGGSGVLIIGSSLYVMISGKIQK